MDSTLWIIIIPAAAFLAALAAMGLSVVPWRRLFNRSSVQDEESATTDTGPHANLFTLAPNYKTACMETPLPPIIFAQMPAGAIALGIDSQ